LGKQYLGKQVWLVADHWDILPQKIWDILPQKIKDVYAKKVADHFLLKNLFIDFNV